MSGSSASWIHSSTHGVQGYKIDRGEESEVPEHLENRNAVLFPKMAAEGLQRRYGEDYFVFARNLYDEGRKYSAVWNGDSYGWKGLRESVRQALRCALMNFPMWGSDTGGYGETTAELFARWSQFAAYTPMMEILIGPGGPRGSTSAEGVRHHCRTGANKA